MAEAQPTVEYRDIPGFPGYRVGSDGSVWTCRKRGGIRTRGTVGGRPWAPLKPNPASKYGHLQVKLYSGAGRGRMAAVHRLVLLAFVGPLPEGMQACHGDGNPRNNALSNLRYGTHADNMADLRRHGTLKGERAAKARLTARLVRRIRAEYAGSCSSLGRRYGVNPCTIRDIIKRRTWAHVA